MCAGIKAQIKVCKCDQGCTASFSSESEPAVLAKYEYTYKEFDQFLVAFNVTLSSTKNTNKQGQQSSTKS